MTENAARPEAENELLILARERDFDALEAAWMERLEAENPDLDELFRVARYLVKKHFDEQAGLLLWSLIQSVSEKTDARAALEVAKRATIAAPGDEILRKELIGLYHKAQPDAVQLDEILEAGRLRKTDNPEDAIAFVDDFLHFQPGAYVVHRLSRRVGRVKGFEKQAYLIEAEGSTYRHEPSDVLKLWDKLSPDHFNALAAFEPDRLRQMARDEVEPLFKLLLQAYKGEADFKQVKMSLIPVVIAQQDWSKWWSAAKTTLKRSPWIKLGTGTQPTLMLRAEATGYSEQVLDRVGSAGDAFAKVAVVIEYLAETKAAWSDDSELEGKLVARLIDEAATAGPAQALALLAAADALHARGKIAKDPSEALAHRLGAIRNAGELLAAIPYDSIARLVLERLRKADAERWPEWYAEAFPAASLRICDIISRELLRVGHEMLFATAAEQTMATPDEFPLAFGWTWRHVLRGGKPLAERLNAVSVTVTLLRLMHRIARMPRHVEGRSEAKRHLSKLRSLVAASSCKDLVGLIDRSDIVDVHRLHEVIATCEGMHEDTRRLLIDALREKHPEEFWEQVNLWEDGFIYMTAAGLAKCEDALAKITNEDMRANAIAIGAAAARGDLRENWEYKAALEERDRMVERATRIREELDRARVIKTEDIPEGEVNVGTSLRLRNVAAGEERTVTFLGPWDADIENGVYSHLAPLSKRFMGKTTCDRVTADFGNGELEYEIVAIMKAAQLGTAASP
jgi:transcription elongation GreA/GreB family factor